MNMSHTSHSIGVVGAGSWGTALAIHLAQQNYPVYLWGRSADKMSAMQSANCNVYYLPQYAFPENLYPTSDINLLTQTDWLLIALPSQTIRPFLIDFKKIMLAPVDIVLASKGLEQSTGYLLYEIVEEVLANYLQSLAVLSGPSFAKEVAAGLPTAMTLASHSAKSSQVIATDLHAQNLRIYTSDDIIGVSLGGALKNVLAIAAGIADGLRFGANSRAALLTRGLAEIIRLGRVLGGRTETFMGLTGLGDLILTATDDQSRNRRFGLALANGFDIEAALAQIGQAVEGIKTAQVAVELAKKHQLELPIIEQTYKIIFEKLDVQQAVTNLLVREQKAETYQ